MHESQMAQSKDTLNPPEVIQGLARENLGHSVRLLDGLLEPSPGAPSFYLIAQAGFKLTANASFARSGLREVCRGVQTAAKALSALFLLATGHGEVEVDVGDGRPRRLAATGPNSFTHCGNWRDGLIAGAICRDQAALEILLHVPIEILRASSSKSDEAYYLYVEAIQALWLRSQDTGSKLVKALRATDPGGLRLTPEDWVLNVLVPELDMASHLADGNADRFNQSLRFALERHKTYWSKGDRKRQSVGFLAFGALAFASLAHDSNIEITVESDYLPQALWQGNCSGLGKF